MNSGKWATVLAACVAAVLLVGCEEGERSNFSHIAFKGEPSVRSEVDPRFRAQDCDSFLILTAGIGDQPITERRLAWMLAWFLESVGYREAPDAREADVVLFLDFSNEHRTEYVPPTSITIPHHQNGRWVESDSVISTPYGTARARGSTWVPGSTTYQQITLPGRTKGSYYPLVALSAFDPVALAASPDDIGKALVWTETIVQSSNVGDGILTGQMLLLGLLEEHPVWPKKSGARGDPLGVALGVRAAMLTADGVNAYPTLFWVAEGSAADKAGLRQWDMLVDVNGQPTANVTWAELADLLAPAAENPKRLVVRRPEGALTVHLTVPAALWRAAEGRGDRE
jgi:hypothetical protein